MSKDEIGAPDSPYRRLFYDGVEIIYRTHDVSTEEGAREWLALPTEYRSMRRGHYSYGWDQGGSDEEGVRMPDALYDALIEHYRKNEADVAIAASIADCKAQHTYCAKCWQFARFDFGNEDD